MSEENIIPRIALKVSSGGGQCPDLGCSINVQNQFRTTSKYLLLDGNISVKYDNEQEVVFSSPYNNTGWMEYVDLWNYDKSAEVKTSDSTSVFVQVTIYNGEANNGV